MNNTRAHQQLVDDILYAVGRLPNIRVWPQVVGTFRDLHSEERIIHVGQKGMADIGGIILVEVGGRGEQCGLRLEIEAKTGDAVMNEDQKKWKNMIEKFGGIYILARSVEQVLTELKKYL